MDFTTSTVLTFSAINMGRIGAFEELIQQINNDFAENHYLSFKQLLHLENDYQVIKMA
jgi:two-component system, response regulator YesN